MTLYKSGSTVVEWRPTGATHANIKSHSAQFGAYVRPKQLHPEALPNKSGTKTSDEVISLENGTAVNHICLCERLTAALGQLHVSVAEARDAEYTVTVAWVFHQFYGRVAKKKPPLKMLTLHLA